MALQGSQKQPGGLVMSYNIIFGWVETLLSKVAKMYKQDLNAQPAAGRIRGLLSVTSAKIEDRHCSLQIRIWGSFFLSDVIRVFDKIFVFAPGWELNISGLRTPSDSPGSNIFQRLLHFLLDFHSVSHNDFFQDSINSAANWERGKNLLTKCMARECVCVCVRACLRGCVSINQLADGATLAQFKSSLFS